MNSIIGFILSGFAFSASAATKNSAVLDGLEIKYLRQGHRGYQEVHLLEAKGSHLLIDGTEIANAYLPLVAREVKLLRAMGRNSSASCYGSSFELTIKRTRERAVERGCTDSERAKAIADSFRRLQDFPLEGQ